MYQVYCDEYLMHDDQLESLKLVAPTITQELNVVGSFTFTIYPTHPYFSRLKKLKSIIKVYQDGLLIFRGRILNDVSGFYNEKQVTCESDLAFLLDSVQRPYEFNGSPSDLFKQFVNEHNAQVDLDKQFKVGKITVTDPNDYITRSDTTYQNTWDAIQDKLIDGLGGYLWIRYDSEEKAYIDYLKKFDWLSDQKIEFGKNLLELKRTIKADDIFTVIIPLGAKSDDSEDRLTIKDVNDGKDYLEHTDGINLYGRITKTVEWDDVTIPNNLKTKAQAYLDNSVMLMNQIELTAADMHTAGANVSSFHLGTNVHVFTEPHGIDSKLLVTKISIDLVNPANNKLALGSTFYSMTEQQKGDLKHVTSNIHKVVTDAKNDAINVTTKQLQSSIQTSAQMILQTVSETYVKADDVNDVVESKMTELKQTVDGWEQIWTTFKKTYDSDKNGTDDKFEEIKKYIRYVDGKIILGEVGNELELRIANDRMSFYQNNTEVAYFNNNKLFVTDGEYTNSLQLGKFAFLPRSTGNLSFKKIRE